MIKKLTLVFVVVSLMAAPAVLADEHLYSFATTSDGNYYIEASAQEIDGSYTEVHVSGYFNESGFACYAWDIFGIVDVIASAKRGTLEVDTGDLVCYSDSGPPSNISVECISNGQLSEHYTGNGTRKYGDGTTDKWHDSTKSEVADCTITADSVLFDQENHDGWLEHRVFFDK